MAEEDIKSFIGRLLQTSDSGFRDKCMKNLEENGIQTIGDLLSLTEQDIDSFGLPLLCKRKVLNELQKLNNASGLTDTEKSQLNHYLKRILL